jgi:hypothetical protein
MRAAFAIFVVVMLSACGQPAPPPPPSPPASSAPAASPPDAAVSSSEPVAVASSPVSSAAPTSPAPLFTYEEGGDRIAFLSPRTTRTTLKSGKSCDDDLPDNGNIWTGRDVENAFTHADVQTALKTHQTYVAAIAGSLQAPGHPGSITWANTCRGCLAAPDGVKRLQDLLKGLMMNRRLLCK